MNEAIKEAIKAMEAAYESARMTDLIYGVQTGKSSIAAWPTKPCRLVFLDFDGVLNSERSNLQMGTRYRFAPRSVAALNSLLQQSNAYIVITSSWRENWTLQENAEFLERDGVLTGRVLGKTPSLGRERGYEIDHWLRSVPYPVESFVILDDRDDMLMHRERLIQTQANTGLTAEHATQALKLLSTPWSAKR